jgi:hypothetical protein
VSLFNSSFARGIFPGLWKRARVVPLKKCSAPNSPKDFRPIAILCFLSKVLEKIAHDQVQEYIAKHKLLDSMQTGFRKHHSTQTAVLKLTDDIRTGLDKKLVTLLLLFDFSKAFDTISPSKLLAKLRKLGFSRAALLWIDSYISEREQMVSTRTNENSGWLKTNLGVPQGSVLGPLLFCLYINDICDVFGSGCVEHILYADDLQIYTQVSRERVDEGISILEKAAKAVSDWAADASLTLNAGKTRAIIFGSNRFINDFYAGEPRMIGLGGGVSVPFSDAVTSLGVVLDSRLTWEPHINCVTKKFNKIMYSLRFFRRYTTEALRKQLAIALLFPHLDYCSVVVLDASQELRRRIQRLQNACVRYVLDLRMGDHISHHRTALGWLRTDTRRQYFLAVLMYKIMRMNTPDYLASLFTRYVPRVAPGRGIKDIAVPFMRTEHGKNSFQVQGAHLWNSLPVEIKYLPSLSRFKTALGGYLLDLE